jgi:hypothetical protein
MQIIHIYDVCQKKGFTFIIIVIMFKRMIHRPDESGINESIYKMGLELIRLSVA